MSILVRHVIIFATRNQKLAPWMRGHHHLHNFQILRCIIFNAKVINLCVERGFWTYENQHIECHKGATCDRKNPWHDNEYHDFTSSFFYFSIRRTFLYHWRTFSLNVGSILYKNVSPTQHCYESEWCYVFGSL